METGDDAEGLAHYRFRWLLLWMSDMLMQEDVEKAKLFLRQQLSVAACEAIGADPLRLLEALERENLIHESDTELLHLVLRTVERLDILERLTDYERERGVVARRLRLRSVTAEGPFFGRRDVLDGVVGALDLDYDHVHLVGLTGLPGTGKSRLAKESLLRLRQFHRVVAVDLQGLETAEAVFFAIMHAFGVDLCDYEPDAMYGFLRTYDSQQHGGTVLFLDSADKPLDPNATETYEAFTDMLQNITNLANSKLKVLLTSRFQVKDLPLKTTALTAWQLDGENELEMESAVELVKYHAGKATLSSNEAEEIILSCSKNPLALKVVASRLQDQTVLAADLVRYLSADAGGQQQQTANLVRALSHLGLALSDRIGPCLQDTVEALPEPHRTHLVRLAVLPGAFTLETARAVLGYSRRQLMELKFDLQALRYRSLLESSSSSSSSTAASGGGQEVGARYTMHLLLRTFVERLALDSQGPLTESFREAEGLFVRHFAKRMRKIAKMLQVKAKVALARLQDDSANYLKALNIIKTSKEYHGQDTSLWLFVVVEMLLFTDQRLKFYKERAQSAKGHGEMQVFAESRAYEAFELNQMGYRMDDILGIFKEAEDALQPLRRASGQSKAAVSLDLSLATVLHLRGDMYLSERKNEAALADIRRALEVRRRYLGDHLLTARTYNSLGSALQEKAVLVQGLSPLHVQSEKEEAMRCYRKALDICQLTAGEGRLHVEAPTFLMNMGTCLHEMDKYSEAVVYYTKALEQERKLGMEGSEKTLTTLKNIAMSYYEMDKYSDAIPIAKKAMEGRKAVLGLHPSTARSIYFVGSLYLENRNYSEARRYLDEALEMEEELWRKGLAHSIDWTRLKSKLTHLMTILGKDGTMAIYKKRFREADKESNRNKPKLDASNSETESSTSSSSMSLQKRKRGSESSVDMSASGTPVDGHRGDGFRGDGVDGLPAHSRHTKDTKQRDKRPRPHGNNEDETNSSISNVSDVNIKMDLSDIQVYNVPLGADGEPLNTKKTWCVLS